MTVHGPYLLYLLHLIDKFSKLLRSNFKCITSIFISVDIVDNEYKYVYLIKRDSTCFYITVLLVIH